MNLNLLNYLWFFIDLIANFPIDEHIFQQNHYIHETIYF